MSTSLTFLRDRALIPCATQPRLKASGSLIQQESDLSTGRADKLSLKLTRRISLLARHLLKNALVVGRHYLDESGEIFVPVIQDALRHRAAGVLAMLFDHLTQFF